MQTTDWIVVGIYFLELAGIVWWSSRRQKTAEDFFLAGRNAGWFVVGTSLFASNIGSEHIVGLAGNGATSGMAMAHWELHAWIMVLLAWVFVSFYYRSGVFTIPEFLEKRFNSATRWVLSVVSLIAYIFTKVSVTVYAGAIVIVIGASLTAPAQDERSISGLTYSALTEQDKKEIRASWTKADVILTAIVLSMVAGVYLYFSFWLG